MLSPSFWTTSLSFRPQNNSALWYLFEKFRSRSFLFASIILFYFEHSFFSNRNFIMLQIFSITFRPGLIGNQSFNYSISLFLRWFNVNFAWWQNLYLLKVPKDCFQLKKFAFVRMNMLNSSTYLFFVKFLLICTSCVF